MQQCEVKVTREFSNTVDGIVRLFEILIRNSQNKDNKVTEKD